MGSLHRWFTGESTELESSNIGVIEITGVISDSMPIMEQIQKVEESESLKALVVRIDSPGGAVGASQEIYMALKALRSKLPVVVSMGNVAASGGLYVSLAGQTVFALPGTLTGSMGVLLELVQVNRLLEKILVDPVTLKSGALKDAGNPSKPLDPKAKEYLQGLIEKNFAEFKRAVVEERKLKPEAASLLSDGRVVDGQEALNLGLVNKLGTFQDAVQEAMTLAKVSGKPKLAFISREPESILERVLHRAATPVSEWLKQSRSVLQYRWDPLQGVH